MSKILKEYWSFEGNTILDPYYLGQVIDFEKESENLKKSTEGDYDYEYLGVNQFLWIVSIKNNIVVRIIYKQNFPIPYNDFWKNHYNVIRNDLQKTSKLVDENYKHDRMCVIIRDGFVNLIILQKGRENDILEKVINKEK